MIRALLGAMVVFAVFAVYVPTYADSPRYIKNNPALATLLLFVFSRPEAPVPQSEGKDTPASPKAAAVQAAEAQPRVGRAISPPAQEARSAAYPELKP